MAQGLTTYNCSRLPSLPLCERSPFSSPLPLFLLRHCPSQAASQVHLNCTSSLWFPPGPTTMGTSNRDQLPCRTPKEQISRCHSILCTSRRKNILLGPVGITPQSFCRTTATASLPQAEGGGNISCVITITAKTRGL